MLFQIILHQAGTAHPLGSWASFAGVRGVYFMCVRWRLGLRLDTFHCTCWIWAILCHEYVRVCQSKTNKNCSHGRASKVVPLTTSNWVIPKAIQRNPNHLTLIADGTPVGSQTDLGVYFSICWSQLCRYWVSCDHACSTSAELQLVCCSLPMVCIRYCMDFTRGSAHGLYSLLHEFHSGVFNTLVCIRYRMDFTRGCSTSISERQWSCCSLPYSLSYWSHSGSIPSKGVLTHPDRRRGRGGVGVVG